MRLILLMCIIIQGLCTPCCATDSWPTDAVDLPLLPCGETFWLCTVPTEDPLPLPEDDLALTFRFDFPVLHPGGTPLILQWWSDQDAGASGNSMGSLEYLSPTGALLDSVGLLRQDFPVGFQESQFVLTNVADSIGMEEIGGVRLTAPGYDSPAEEMESESGEVTLQLKNSREGNLMLLVPEPSSVLMILIGLGGLMSWHVLKR